jgi:hypothetical protein
MRRVATGVRCRGLSQDAVRLLREVVHNATPFPSEGPAVAYLIHPRVLGEILCYLCDDEYDIPPQD